MSEYKYTGKYAWSKASAEKRANKARKAGYSVKIVPKKSVTKKKQGYALFAKTTPKGYGWAKNKK